MKKSFLFLLLIFSIFLVNGQYSIESYSKSYLGIPIIEINKEGFMPFSYTINSGKIKNRGRYINFYEADSTLYYYNNDTIYNINSNTKFPVEDNNDFLYFPDNSDTILDYIIKFKPELKKDKISYLFDSNDRIWFHSKKNDGLMVLIDNRLIHYLKTLEFPHSYISRLLEDSEGNIWVTSAYGVSIFSSNRWKTLDKTSKNKNVGGVKNIFPFSSNQMLILTNRNKLLSYKNSNLHEINILKHKQTYYENLDSDEVYKKVNYKYKKPYDMLAVDSSEIWISFSNNEIGKLDSDNKFKFYVSENSTNIYKLIDAYLDSYGNKWIITGNKILKINNSDNLFTSIKFDGLNFRGFYEEKHRLWFFGNNSTIHYNYETNELVCINEKFNIDKNISTLSSAGYYMSKLSPSNSLLALSSGKHLHINYFNAGIVEGNNDNSLYIQYGIGTLSSTHLAFEFEKLIEDPLILLYLEKECINLTEELAEKDNRPLGAYLDSYGNFWIDTPTAIHRISLN